MRERLSAGDTDQEVKDYLVARYGEYVLLRPTFSSGNMILWLGGPGLLIVGACASLLYVRRARPEAQANAAPLSEAERERLDRLMREDP